MSVAVRWLKAQKEQEENTRRKIEMARHERGLQSGFNSQENTREQEEKLRIEREEKQKLKREQEEREKREREEKEKREREEREKREREEKEKREREKKEKREQEEEKKKRECEEELKKLEEKELQEPEDKNEKEKNDKRGQELGQVKSTGTHLETRKLSDPPLNDAETIVIDNGSTFIKAGLAGNEKPWSIFPCVVGKQKYIYGKTFMTKQQNIFVGELALAKSGVLKMKYPIEKGLITNFDWMTLPSRSRSHRPYRQ